MRLHPIIAAHWRTVLLEAPLVAGFIILAGVGLHVAFGIYAEFAR